MIVDIVSNRIVPPFINGEMIRLALKLLTNDSNTS